MHYQEKRRSMTAWRIGAAAPITRKVRSPFQVQSRTRPQWSSQSTPGSAEGASCLFPIAANIACNVMTHHGSRRQRSDKSDQLRAVRQWRFVQLRRLPLQPDRSSVAITSALISCAYLLRAWTVRSKHNDKSAIGSDRPRTQWSTIAAIDALNIGRFGRAAHKAHA